MELIGKPVDPHTLHAVLNICVRFTRQYANAQLIAEEGVVEKLLKLTDASNFCGIYGLSTMLIRHILEEPSNISAAMERVKTVFIFVTLQHCFEALLVIVINLKLILLTRTSVAII